MTCSVHQGKVGSRLVSRHVPRLRLNSSYKETGVSLFTALKLVGVQEKELVASRRRKRRHFSSEEVGLTHDAHELILADFTITIAVGLLDHLLDLVVGHVLAELLSDSL